MYVIHAMHYNQLPSQHADVNCADMLTFSNPVTCLVHRFREDQSRSDRLLGLDREEREAVGGDTPGKTNGLL